jgi:transcriptional regulator with XRE-family HTH domain
MARLFLHDRLRTAIEESGMTQKEVAAKARISKRTLDAWMRSDPPIPNALDFWQVSQVLGKPMDWYFTERPLKMVPPRLVRLCEDLALLSEDQIDTVKRVISPWAEHRRQERAV